MGAIQRPVRTRCLVTTEGEGVAHFQNEYSNAEKERNCWAMEPQGIGQAVRVVGPADGQTPRRKHFLLAFMAASGLSHRQVISKHIIWKTLQGSAHFPGLNGRPAFLERFRP